MIARKGNGKFANVVHDLASKQSQILRTIARLLHLLVAMIFAPQRRISSFPGLTMCLLHMCEEGSRACVTTRSHCTFVPVLS